VLLPEERARLELAASLLAAVPSFWLWVLATVQLRSGHHFQWLAAVATAALTVFFGLRAAYTLQQTRRFAGRTRLLESMGETRITLQPASNPIPTKVHSKAITAVLIARLLAELGWLLERPTNGPITIAFAVALAGFTLIAGALWLSGLVIDLSGWIRAAEHQVIITERPSLEGVMKIILVAPAIARASAIVATLSVPSGGRFSCRCDANMNVREGLGERAYELELRLDNARSVPWSDVGNEKATLELLVAPGVTATFALGFELDAFRPQRSWY
jgi:hypothetical protein